MNAAGIWYNELGSEMVLTVNGASVTGTYNTAVGHAGGEYALVGGLDVDGDPTDAGQAIGWVVVWTNQAKGSSHSVTTWSGQYQIIDGNEEIETLWLLTSETPTDEDWAATQINKDTFKRTQPTPEAIARAYRKRMPSHPV